jgi:hypothetical protein
LFHLYGLIWWNIFRLLHCYNQKERNGDCMSETGEKVGAGVGGAAGTAAGVGGGVAAVSAAGTTAGLSGPGIMAGLTAIGGTALGGIAVIAVGSVALAAAGAFGGYKLVKWLKR